MPFVYAQYTENSQPQLIAKVYDDMLAETLVSEINNGGFWYDESGCKHTTFFSVWISPTLA